MTDGFKRAATLSRNEWQAPADEIKLPVTGYTGHRIGYKS
jgi:hypothetical protein